MMVPVITNDIFFIYVTNVRRFGRRICGRLQVKILNLQQANKL